MVWSKAPKEDDESGAAVKDANANLIRIQERTTTVDAVVKSLSDISGEPDFTDQILSVIRNQP
jgi:hypothetical protein